MSASVQRDGQRLRLAGDLDFASAGALREQLTALIAGSAGQTLILDLSAVSRSNSVGLSLLLSAARSAEEHKVDLHTSGLPSGLLSMARVCGLDDWLQKLSVEPLDLKETPHATP